MTILAVQAGILNFTLKQYESDRLNQVRKLGIAAVTPMVDPRAIDPLAPPFTDEQVNRLLSNGEVQGLAVYSGQLDLIKTYGEPMALTLFNKDANNLSKTYRTADGDSYEVVFRVDTMARSYIMVSRLNSSAFIHAQ